MNSKFLGFLIRKERLRRDWSQEGLCRGICAVSYLSKIEQGKVEAGGEIIALLFERMEIKWYDDEENAARNLAERFYEAFFSNQSMDVITEIKNEFEQQKERLQNGPCALDFMLMQRLMQDVSEPIEAEFEPYLDERQLALQRVLQGRYDDALRLYPCAHMYFLIGCAAYERGENAVAMEYLRASYDLSSEDGQIRSMMMCRLYMGNCYSNLLDFARMREHYAVAERIATALGDEEILFTVRYNTSSTAMEVGQYEQPYEYFSKLEEHSISSLHKLAICCEKLGKREEALHALERTGAAEGFSEELELRMCEPVRYRLEHPGYLQDGEYGRLLLGCFAEVREKLPIGYANFHIPWVLEWYTASRQYKQAYELLRNFPLIR